MTDCHPLAPDRDGEKGRQEQAGTSVETGAGRGREPSGSVTVRDIGSPYGSADSRQSYESLDFGESGEELI